jgi:hypothetical protein
MNLYFFSSFSQMEDITNNKPQFMLLKLQHVLVIYIKRTLYIEI